MVKVKLFANFREIAGKKEIEIDAKDTEELLEKLAKIYPEFKKLYDYAILMVNGNIAKSNVKLKKDDTVAIFPPLSGG
uniref:MoaD/ThiS family protein n=1 Tax=Geoglobus ahangari TaxID=113653 RepID=A0A7C4S815_9EURY